MSIAPAIRQRSEDQVESILAAATPLFAEHGFDGVTTRQLAAAVGLNIATVHHHVGTKAELYRRVVGRLQSQELAVAQAFAAETSERSLPDAAAFRDLLFELMDRLLGQMLDEPARARLYVRRWMNPDDLARPDAEVNAAAFHDVLTGIFSRAARAGVPIALVDVPLLLRSFDWLVLGYFVTGLERGGGAQGNPFDEINVTRFREHLRRYLCRMLQLPERAG